MRLGRYLTRMAIFLALVLGVGALLVGRLESAFLANPYLNALLIAVWLFGIVYLFWVTLGLAPAIRWVRAVQRSRLAAVELDSPPLMSPLARLMEDRSTPLSLTPTSLRSVLDGIAVRLDENRDIARYLTGLMIFLGLLGTFWGLLKTVGSVGAVVGGLSLTADPAELFRALKAGLEAPLSGMGTAFSSSLLGLAGSLVLGFLDLQMGQAQNRFFIELEDWLFASVRGDRGAERLGSPAYLEGLVAQTAENLDRLRLIAAAPDETRRALLQAIERLTEQVAGLAEAQRASQAAFQRSTDADAALVRVIGHAEQALASGAEGLPTQMRAIAATLARLEADQASGRAQAIEAIGGEIKLLARLLGTAIDQRAEG